MVQRGYKSITIKSDTYSEFRSLKEDQDLTNDELLRELLADEE